MAKTQKIKTDNNEIVEVVDERYMNKYVSVRNEILRAKEQTNLLESKIELLATYKLKENFSEVTKLDAKKKPYSVKYITINSSDIIALTGRKDKSIYEHLFAAAVTLKEKMAIIMDRDTQQFRLTSLYEDVYYSNGLMTIEFNPQAEHMLLDMGGGNFSQLMISMAFSFKTNGAYQLYKLLKSESYKLGDFDKEVSQEDQRVISLEYDLNDLRYSMGYLNLKQQDIRVEAAKAHPDIEKIASMDRSPMYQRFTDFNNRVLGPGVKEINKISDLYIAGIDRITTGKGGRIVSLIFNVQHNVSFYKENREATKNTQRVKGNRVTPKVSVSEEELLELVDRVIEMVPVKIKASEAKRLIEISGYDIDRVEKAVLVMDAYSKNHKIDSVVAFLKKAIEDDYETPVGKGKVTGFDNYSSRDNDYERIQRELLLKSMEK